MSRNVVDSSGWLEYFSDSDRADYFEEAILDQENLVVPVITIYEVFKKVLRERGESQAFQVASQMQNGLVVDLDISLALAAGKHLLPLADSIIYTTALHYHATLWTQDKHFADLPNIKYFAKA
jgi:predicted nucleic acid-binding protein